MKRVTLSFDNGPTPGVTDAVLEHLERAGILTTFFVIGQKLRDPAALALARAAHAAGHWIGNHTLTHSTPLGERLEAEFAQTEIGGAQALIGALAHPDRLFRPYGGGGLVGRHLLSPAARDYLLENRYCTALWTSVPGDWRDPEGWVERCVSDVGMQQWSVVVLHDIAGACLDRLPELLDRLNGLGVEWRQDFPQEVILTRGGDALDPCEEFVALG